MRLLVQCREHDVLSDDNNLCRIDSDHGTDNGNNADAASNTTRWHGYCTHAVGSVYCQRLEKQQHDISGVTRHTVCTDFDPSGHRACACRCLSVWRQLVVACGVSDDTPVCTLKKSSKKFQNER
jgi:hypothetical protein